MKVLFFAAVLYVVVVAVLARRHLPELHPRRFFLETWRDVDRAAAEARARRQMEGKGYDWRPLIALVLVSVVLTLQEYFGDRTTWSRFVNQGLVIDWGGGPSRAATHHWKIFGPQAWMNPRAYGDLAPLTYWSFTRSLGYFVLPAIALKLWGERVRDYGLRGKGFLSHAWIYALFFGIVLIAVVLVAGTDSGLPNVIHGGALHRELQALVESGFTTAEALASATSVAAKVLLPGERVGVIEAGARADLLLVEGDPLEDLTALERIVGVWRDGRAVVRAGAY